MDSVSQNNRAIACPAATVDHEAAWQCPHCRAPMRIGPHLSASQLRSRCLADNAVKFTERGSIQIHCECATQGDQSAVVEVFVKDTGIGISPDHHEFIFQKFSQIDGSLTRRQGGTGLGLALAKELIELMDGEIGVQSRLNAGSCFWFRLRLPVAGAPNRPEDVFVNAG